jgi:hypothetical protein
VQNRSASPVFRVFGVLRNLGKHGVQNTATGINLTSHLSKKSLTIIGIWNIAALNGLLEEYLLRLFQCQGYDDHAFCRSEDQDK